MRGPERISRADIDSGHVSREAVSTKNITATVGDDILRRARTKATGRYASVSGVARGFPIRRSGEETGFERLERLQNETLHGIHTFRAGDRLTREEILSRGGGRRYQRTPRA